MSLPHSLLQGLQRTGAFSFSPTLFHLRVLPSFSRVIMYLDFSPRSLPSQPLQRCSPVVAGEWQNAHCTLPFLDISAFYSCLNAQLGKGSSVFVGWSGGSGAWSFPACC